MNKVKDTIGWADFSINPIRGLCKYACSYCYARRMYKRFHWNPEVRLELDCMWGPLDYKQPSRIFLCSTHDIMGEWIPDSWIRKIIERIKICQPQHTWFVLSKNPARYANFEWPKNCKLGYTMTKDPIPDVDSRKIDFVSFEPLLERITRFPKVKWYIIGGLTPKPIHKKEWIDEIVKVSDAAKIPVFIKDNAKYPVERKEFVNVK